MCLIPYLKVYHGSKKCLGSFFSNGLLCWERGNALNPLSLPFAGWEEERPGGEDKKTMVVLLVFIYDYFGGSFWSEKKNCWKQKVNLAGCCSRERALSTNSKTSLPLVSHDLPLKRLANWLKAAARSEQKVDEFYPQFIEELSSIR